MTTRNARTNSLKAIVAAGLLAMPGMALADVNAGVAAWEQGDYAAAVAQWREPAAQGDADAQFNMGQAYRLGRGVEQNTRQAEVYYAKAAAQGHLKAADNLGLLLFQGGRQQEAMPYVLDAASRGDPRAQYLLGIAHFNGDLVARDWVRAYALITLANAPWPPDVHAHVDTGTGMRLPRCKMGVRMHSADARAQCRHRCTCTWHADMPVHVPMRVPMRVPVRVPVPVLPLRVGGPRALCAPALICRLCVADLRADRRERRRQDLQAMERAAGRGE